jgi:DNA-directed RNA polymerase specialized sigma24 family protein
MRGECKNAGFSESFLFYKVQKGQTDGACAALRFVFPNKKQSGGKVMKIKDFETLSRLIGGDVRKQRSVLKGQFHAYIMRRMRWHARRYYYRNRDKVITISLEDMNEDVPDEQEAERMRCRELLIALQQELPHLTPTERQIAQSLLKKSCSDTAADMGLCNSTVYRTRRKIGKKVNSWED